MINKNKFLLEMKQQCNGIVNCKLMYFHYIFLNLLISWFLKIIIIDKDIYAKKLLLINIYMQTGAKKFYS